MSAFVGPLVLALLFVVFGVWVRSGEEGCGSGACGTGEGCGGCPLADNEPQSGRSIGHVG